MSERDLRYTTYYLVSSSTGLVGRGLVLVGFFGEAVYCGGGGDRAVQEISDKKPCQIYSLHFLSQ